MKYRVCEAISQFKFTTSKRETFKKMDIKICILFVIIAFAELMSSGDAAETDENNNELENKSKGTSRPYQSVYNMDFMKGKGTVFSPDI